MIWEIYILSRKVDTVIGHLYSKIENYLIFLKIKSNFAPYKLSFYLEKWMANSNVTLYSDGDCEVDRP